MAEDGSILAAPIGSGVRVRVAIESVHDHSTGSSHLEVYGSAVELAHKRREDGDGEVAQESLPGPGSPAAAAAMARAGGAAGAAAAGLAAGGVADAELRAGLAQTPQKRKREEGDDGAAVQPGESEGQRRQVCLRAMIALSEHLRLLF